MSTDVHDKILLDLGTIVSGLTLAGVAGVIGDVQGVLVQLLGEQLSIPAFPYVLVSTTDEAEEEIPSDFTFDHVIYPGVIEVVDSLQPNYQQRRKVYLTWRRQIAGALRGKLGPPVLATATEAYDMRLRPRPIVKKSDASGQLVRTGLGVRVWTREVRVRT